MKIVKKRPESRIDEIYLDEIDNNSIVGYFDDNETKTPMGLIGRTDYDEYQAIPTWTDHYNTTSDSTIMGVAEELLNAGFLLYSFKTRTALHKWLLSYEGK